MKHFKDFFTMGKLLFTIEDTIQFESIDLVVSVNIKIKDAKIKNDDEIELRLSDSSVVITKV